MTKSSNTRGRTQAAQAAQVVQIMMLGLGALLPAAVAAAAAAPDAVVAADGAAAPAAAAASADPAAAPEAAAAQPDQPIGALETVTVTAQRRRENIRDVPVSVTAIGGAQLDVLTSGGEDIRVLSGRIPSLNVESSTGRVSPRFYIRGYGNTDFTPFASQPVSLIMDDVVQENVILKGVPLFDLENVEVLRGPQGTLFGRNTPAGVVKFESVKPSFDGINGYYSLTDGTHNTAIAEAAVNVPLSEVWAMRIASQVQHRDNWVQNTGNNYGNLDGYEERAARLQLLYKPSATFDALFNLHARGTEGSARLFRANLLSQGSDSIAPGYSPGTININGLNTQNLHSAGGNVRVNWDLGDYIVHAITGYEHVSSFLSRGDIDGGSPNGPGFIPFQVETASVVPTLHQFTQELRLESKNSGRFNWQTGVYYFNENAVADSYGYDTVTEAQSSLLRNEQKNEAAAVFGSLSYDVNDRLKLRAGLRYTHDKKDFSTEIAQNVTFTGPGGVSESKSKTNWDVSADYAVSKELSAYARVATGFRAPSIAAPSQSAPITVADDETVTSYEAGIKAELFQRRARFNVSVYDFEVKNQQLTAVGGTSNSITLINAKKTVGRGVESDFEARITPTLRVNVSGSYNFTKIEDPNLYTGACGAPCTVQNPVSAQGFALVDGNPLPQAPKWIFNAGVRYSLPLANYNEAYLQNDWSYRSKVNLFLYQSLEFTGKPLLDGSLRAGYKWDGGKYDAAFFVRNLLDKQVVTGAIDFDNFTGFTNEPRAFGLQLRSTF
ncbi:TonB-dependent receptor [Rugamonas sp.]|uniref:TonB-dependent receptor n=1 Tax=Rugamonas sp. TaxID=1926287 RepID=UPI0025FC6F58|nr:TonB-dependent receptor [Rugamonas sp.]